MTPSLLLSALLLAPRASAEDGAAFPKPKPTGLLQAWLTAYDMDEDRQADPASYGDPEDDPGLKLRRARVGLTGESDVLQYAVVVGVSAPYDALTGAEHEVGLVDAYLGWAPVKDLWLSAGVAKPPVSREQLMGSSQLPLAERAVSSEWMVPDRDAGAWVDWRSRGSTRVRLRGGAFNGNADIFGDDNNGKLLAARAELAHGPAGTYATWGEEKGFSLGVGGDVFHDTDIATSTLGAGGDVMMRVAGMHLLLEGRFARLAPRNSDVDQPGVLAPVSRLGGLAQVGYGIGPVEPTVRFSLFDDDQDASDNGDVAQLDAGLTGHLMDDRLRVGGGYVMRLEMAGATVSNDTVRLWSSVSF